MTNAIFQLPGILQRTRRLLRSRHPGAGPAQGRAGAAVRPGGRHPPHHRRPGGAHRPAQAGGVPPRARACAGPLPRGGGGGDPPGHRRRPGGQGRLGEHPLGGARGHLQPHGQPHLHPVPLHPQRRHHARPVQDRPPGGDRRHLRDGGLLPLQRQVQWSRSTGPSPCPTSTPGTGCTTGPWRGSCWPCRPSTSRPSPPTWPPRRPSWATRWCGSPPPPPSSPTTT